MDTTCKKTVYEIVTGSVNKGDLEYTHSVGQAKLYEGNSYYVLKLAMYREPSYFLVKNKGSLNEYTIYSKAKRDEGETRFRDVVGYGRLRGDIKSYLELRFHLFNKSLFMSLFPKPAKGDQ
jgi:hypothetical protein